MRGRSHLIIGTLSAVELSLILGVSITPLSLVFSALFSILPDVDEPNSKAMDYIISKKFTEKLYNTLVVLSALIVFYIYTRTGNSLFLGILSSILVVNLLKKKISCIFFRSIFVSISLMLLSTTLYLYKIDLSIVIFTFIISIFPLLKHRGWTHSLTMVLVFYLLLGFMDKVFGTNFSLFCVFSYLIHLLGDIITKRGIPLLYPFIKRNFSIGTLKVGSLFCNLIEYFFIFILFILILISL